jgi:hypothetical protein
MAFTNGVYDFKNFKFREGMPDDYVSKSTNIAYEPFDPKSKEYHEIS